MKRVLFLVLFLSPICLAGRILEDGIEWFAEDGFTDPFTAYPVSVAFWCRPDDEDDVATIWFWGDDTVSNQYLRINLRADLDPNSLEISRSNTSGSSLQTSTGVTIGQWHQVTAVFASATSAKIWLDGAGGVEDTNSISYPTDPNTFALGRDEDPSPTNYFKGGLAYVTVWSSNIDAGTNIADLAAGTDPEDVDAANIVASWRLEESSPLANATETTYTLTRQGSPAPIDVQYLIGLPDPDGQDNVIITVIGM